MPSDLVSLDTIRAAARRLQGIALHTPLVRLDLPGLPGELFLKAECLQPIGSFKLRGAYNRIAQLLPEEQRRGVITYSSGNHAQGVAYAARTLGIHAVIVMPSNAPAVKRAATQALGAEILSVGPGSLERKQKAEELAAERGYVVIPPYDDDAIVAGQGTCGLEIAADMPDVDLVLVPVGGGGLVSGVSAAVKQSLPGARVIGVEPELAADARASLAEGRIVSWTAEQTSRTVADGLRTQSVGIRNFAHIQAFVDAILLVKEEEIRRAQREIVLQARLVAEPSGAVAAAAALFHQEELPPFRKAVAIVSGGNTEAERLSQLLSAE